MSTARNATPAMVETAAAAALRTAAKEAAAKSIFVLLAATMTMTTTANAICKHFGALMNGMKRSKIYCGLSCSLSCNLNFNLIQALACVLVLLLDHSQQHQANDCTHCRASASAAVAGATVRVSSLKWTLMNFIWLIYFSGRFVRCACDGHLLKLKLIAPFNLPVWG